jgi:WD40 repeat protein
MRNYLLCLTLIALLVLTPLLLAQPNQPPERIGIWSPDGQALALSTPGAFQIFHAGQLEPVTLPAQSRILAAAFSSTGALLAAWDEEQVVSVWDARTGDRIAQRSYADGHGRVLAIAFSPDDHVVAFNYYDLTQFMGGKHPARPIDKALQATASPTPSRPITYKSGVYIWDYQRNSEPQVLSSSGYADEIVLALSRDLSTVATVSYGAQNRTGRVILTVFLSSTQTGENTKRLNALGYSLRDLRFSPTDSTRVVMLTNNGVVRFWDTSTETELFALTLLPNRIRALAYSDDGKMLATGGIDGKVRLWDAESGAMLEVYPGQPADVRQLRFTGTGDLLAFGDPLAYLRVWNARTLQTVSDFRPQPPPTPAPSYLPTYLPLPTLLSGE